MFSIVFNIRDNVCAMLFAHRISKLVLLDIFVHRLSEEESINMEDLDVPIADNLLRLVSIMLPIVEWRQIGMESLDLTLNELDAIESRPSKREMIFQVMYKAVHKLQITAEQLLEKLEKADISVRQTKLFALEKCNMKGMLFS